MSWRKFIIFVLWTWSLSANAWQVSVDNNRISVSSDENHTAVQVYLVWFDLDSPIEKAINSWTIAEHWQSGIQAIVPETLDISPFETINVDDVKPVCAPKHRCFVALLATAEGQDPAIIDNWLASSILPLNDIAAFERFPGQTRFNNLQPNNELVYSDTALTSDTLNAPKVSAAPVAIENKQNDATAANSANTEKPDIFRYFDNKLFYANAASKRLQVIDLSDTAAPVLKINKSLEQQPQEIYQINDFYVLLQTEQQYPTASTQLNVFSYDESNTAGLISVSSLNITGSLIESRRRDDVIYSVIQATPEDTVYPVVDDAELTNSSVIIGEWKQLSIQASRLDAIGHLDSIAYQTIGGYGANIAIFADHLVISHQKPYDWGKTLIDVFELNDATAPLKPLGTITINGYVPSELHVSVSDHYLQVVYQDQDRSQGSHLTIFDLIHPQLNPVGEVKNIAAGERLYATRFTPDYAYIVTFLQTDPLWVIDLNNPENPKIVGELKVPGWSEKMFFNQGRLFALGYDDRAGREISLSLFDVNDPTQPRILDRFTPASNEEKAYTNSPAIQDERALLLNWANDFAAVPINYGYNDNNPYQLQLVNFDLDLFVNRGYVSFPEPVSRSFIIDNNHLGVLGNDNFYTVKWGADVKPEIEATLPLARRLDAILMETNSAWAIQLDPNRKATFYRLNSDNTVKNLDLIEASFSFPNYQVNQSNSNDLYITSSHNYPAELYVFDKKTELTAQIKLNVNLNNSQSGLNQQLWYNSGIIYNDNSSRPLQIDIAYIPEEFYQQFILQTVDLATPANIQRSYITPGQIIGYNADSNFISLENDRTGGIRFNILEQMPDGLRLLRSELINCSIYNYHKVLVSNNHIYMNCQQPDNKSQLLKLNAQNLNVIEEVNLLESYQIDSVVDDVLFLRANNRYFNNAPYPLIEPEFATTQVVTSSIASDRLIEPQKQACQLAKINNNQLETLHTFDDCPYNNQLGFNANTAYITQAYEAVKVIHY